MSAARGSVAAMAWVLACGGGGHAKPDSALGSGSNAGSGSGSAAICTGTLYDPCTGSDCMPGLTCEDFRGHGFMVCTESCPISGDGSSCPIPSGSDFVACTGMDVCSPGAANDCVAP